MLKQNEFINGVVSRLSAARSARQTRRRKRRRAHDHNLESLEPRVVLSASPGTVSPLANLGYVADDGPLQTIHLNTDNDPQGDNPFQYSFGSASPHYGGRAHTILSGDFDGDGDDTVVAVEEVPFYEKNDLHTPVHLRWLVDDNRNPTDEFRFRFGLIGDIPLVGDMNGDGIDDAIVVRPGTVGANGLPPTMTWYVSHGPFPAQNGSHGAFAPVNQTFVYAFNGDTPIVGDWDGDGRDNLGLVSQKPTPDGHFRWYKHGSGTEDFGPFSPNNVPVTGDFDGDGTDELAYVERRGTGEAKWYFQQDNDPQHDATIVFGTNTAQFLVGQWTQPDFRINDVSIVEGDSGQSNLKFTVSLTAPGNAGKAHPSQVPVSVEFATVNGTAHSGEDYVAKSGKLTFQPGETSKTINIPIVGDTKDENNENFDVRLRNPVHGQIADSTGRGTIFDNDFAPVTHDISIADGRTSERFDVEFALTLDKPAKEPVTVEYRTVNGTATSGSDYVGESGTVRFETGDIRQTIRIDSIDDEIDEPNETFQVLLSNPKSGVIKDGNATGTIVDNDPAPSIRVNDQSITEGNTGRQDMNFTVSLSAASANEVTVRYQTEDGTAKAGLDYDARQGILTFKPGEKSKTVSVPVIGDVADETTELFLLRLSDPSNADISDDVGEGSIIDNDLPKPNVARIADASIVEGNFGKKDVEFTVTLTRGTESEVRLSFHTINGTAIAGQDYDAVQGTLTFKPGETRKTISVPILGDTQDEPNETFDVKLAVLQNAVFGDGIATGTIIDNDDAAPKPGSISGLKWNDLDGDRIRDANEPGLSSWTIYIDQNRNGRLDDGERSTLTDSNGRFEFGNVDAGEYYVSEILQPGWRQTFPDGGSSAAVVGFSGDSMLTGDVDARNGGISRSTTLTTTASTVAVSVETPELASSSDASPQLDKSSDLIGIDDFRNDSRFNGIDGSGFSTVIIDTGIDVDHPFFGADADGNGVADRIVYQYDFVNERPDASDQFGHGSHVAGIVGSEDSRFTGMAPGTDIIALKVFSQSSGSFADVEQALQWVVSNASTYNIASVNMSLGDNGNYSSSISLYGLDDELRELAEMGVIVVSAAGNSYASFQSEGLAYPAADPNSLAVSSVFTDDFGRIGWSGGAVDFSTGPDRVVSHSQRHSELTDVFAPGALITSANNLGGTSVKAGTSMAAPHVAGVATLAQQIAVEGLGRRLTVDEFRTLLSDSGKQIFDGDDENDNVRNTGKEYKRLDMVKLADAILDLGRVTPHIVTVKAGEAVTGVDFGSQRLKPKASVANAAPVVKGESAAFNIMLDRPYSEAVTVSWEADGLTNAAAGTVTFAPGETMQLITLATDGMIAGESQITTRLTSVDHADILDAIGVGMVSGNVLSETSLTANVEFEESTGTLTVNATSASQITIGSSNDENVDITVNGSSLASPEVEKLSAANVTSIVVNGSSDGDSIDLSDVVPGIFSSLLNVEINGLRGNDTIVGSEFDDVIRGGQGHDRLSGMGGHDQLSGHSGNDTITGENGEDVLHGGSGKDRLHGDSGNDQIVGGAAADIITGGDGDDTLVGRSGADRIFGGNGNDVIKGGTGRDELVGDAGGDSITGNGGRDLIQGGSDADVLVGSTGADTLAGGSGDDLLTGRFLSDLPVRQPKIDSLDDGTSGTADQSIISIPTDSDDVIVTGKSGETTESVTAETQFNTTEQERTDDASDVDFIAEGSILDAIFADALYSAV